MCGGRSQGLPVRDRAGDLRPTLAPVGPARQFRGGGQRLASQRAENLSKALQSNREIGVAMGILMNQHQFTRQESFDVMRVASQNSHRKLADIAVEVADTGALAIEHHG